MNLFSKNNYKYLIIFLIVFIFIVLIYGNYNFQINIIENMSVTMSDTSRCSNTNNVNNANLSGMAVGEIAVKTASAAEGLNIQANCDKK
tara:strand:- start:2143 stop:2409 length:267 start_codon:yes stop_codon:yes gene_type:complete